MKFTIISASIISGLSSKTGNPFKMFRASVLSPFVPRSTANFQASGAGLTVADTEVSEHFIDSLITRFSTDFKGSPIEYDFDIALTQNGAVIVGFMPENPLVESKPAMDFSPKKSV